MKKTLLTLSILFVAFSLCAQQLHIEGKIRIDSMDLDNESDDIVVRKQNGVLAIRQISTLSDIPVSPELVASLGIGTNPRSGYVAGHYAYIVDIDSDELKIIDVSNPSAATMVGSMNIGGFSRSLYVSGRYAYVVLWGGHLKIIDVSNAASPSIVGSLGIGSFPNSIKVSGPYAYVVDHGSDDLKVIDVSDPTTPFIAGSLAIGGTPVSIYVSGRYAYVVDQNSEDLKVIDVDDPTMPTLTGSLSTGPEPNSIHVSANYAYVVDGSLNVFQVIDVSDPTAPSVVGGWGIGGSPQAVYVSGRYAYVVDQNSDDLKVIDVTYPIAPFLAGTLIIGGNPRSVHVLGRYAYVVSQITDDLKVIDISGGEYTSLMAHSLEAGNLQVRNDLVAQGQLQVTGGLNIGAGGLFSDGDVGVHGSLKLQSSIHLGAISYFAAGDDAVVFSDTTKNASDIFLVANDAVILEISDNGSENGSFEVWNNNSSSRPLKLEESGDLSITGIMTLGQLGTAGVDALCRNGSDELALCSSSRRYKKDIRPYKPPASILNQLRPVTYRWRDSDKLDIGLIAEEVVKIEPLLVHYNEQGKVEGVKYDRVGLLLIDEIRKLKTEIHKLTSQHEHMNTRLDRIEKSGRK